MKMLHKSPVVRCLCMVFILCSLLWNVNASEIHDVTDIPILSEQEKDISALTVDALPSQLREELAGGDSSSLKITAFDETDADDLNTVVAIKEDGTHSMFTFAEPIKYVDEATNAIHFIDNTFVAPEENALERIFSQTAYENAANSLRVALPKRIKQGILLEQSNRRLQMTPVTSQNSSATKKEVCFLGQTQSMVEYEDAFGENVHLQYAAVNQGIKENILLEEYTGVNEFSFIIEAKGLVPDVSQGAIIQLLDEETGDAVFQFNRAWAMDSYNEEDAVQESALLEAAASPEDAENEAKHFEDQLIYRIESQGNDRYFLTLVVPTEFLCHPDTVYPVLIDPYTTYITAGTNNSNELDYVTVYSRDAKTTKPHNAVVGKDSLGEAITYIKMGNSVKQNVHINPNRISQASIHMKQVVNGAAYNVSLYDSSTSVSLSGANYNTISTSLGNVQSTEYCFANIDYSWDMTALYRAWLGYELSGNGWSSYQFMIKADDLDRKPKQFLCSSNNLWLQVDYTVDDTLTGLYYIRNAKSGQYLDAVWPVESGVNINQWSFTGNVNQLWEIHWQGNGRYRLYPKAGNQFQYSIAVSADNVTLQNHVNADTRDYCIVSNNDGSYRLMSDNSGSWKAFDVYNASSANGANVIAYTYRGTQNQKWILEKVTDYCILDSVPQIGQETNMWCWVACAQMMAKHYYPNSTKTQSMAVLEINGRLTDAQGRPEAASILKAASAAEYFTDYNIDFEAYYAEGMTATTLKNRIINNKPVYLSRGADEGYSHSTIAYGYVNYKGLRFLIRDPWRPKDSISWEANPGITLTMTFEDIKNGQLTGFDDKKWLYYMNEK